MHIPRPTPRDSDLVYLRLSLGVVILADTLNDSNGSELQFEKHLVKG